MKYAIFRLILGDFWLKTHNFSDFKKISRKKHDFKEKSMILRKNVILGPLKNMIPLKIHHFLVLNEPLS